tara:strand:- start:3222 stop:3503 length:282 start_codon:yes stop_codon:yes gene_type:complete
MMAVVPIPQDTEDPVGYLEDRFPHYKEITQRFPSQDMAIASLKVSSDGAYALIPCHYKSFVEDEVGYAFFSTYKIFSDYLKTNWQYWEGDDDE